MSDRLTDVDLAIRDHFARIHRAALILTGNPWDADDLAQETFLVFSRNFHQFAGRSALYTWLYGILLNLERRERRRRGARWRTLVDWVARQDSSPTQAPPADRALEAEEWKRSLWGHVARLPDGQRQSLVLRFSEGLRYEEIAAVLKCPVGTVKSRVFHGLLTLRRTVGSSSEFQTALPPHRSADDVGGEHNLDG